MIMFNLIDNVCYPDEDSTELNNKDLYNDIVGYLELEIAQQDGKAKIKAQATLNELKLRWSEKQSRQWTSLELKLHWEGRRRENKEDPEFSRIMDHIYEQIRLLAVYTIPGEGIFLQSDWNASRLTGKTLLMINKDIILPIQIIVSGASREKSDSLIGIGKYDFPVNLCPTSAFVK